VHLDEPRHVLSEDESLDRERLSLGFDLGDVVGPVVVAAQQDRVGEILRRAEQRAERREDPAPGAGRV